MTSADDHEPTLLFPRRLDSPQPAHRAHRHAADTDLLAETWADGPAERAAKGAYVADAAGWRYRHLAWSRWYLCRRRVAAAAGAESSSYRRCSSGVCSSASVRHCQSIRQSLDSPGGGNGADGARP